MGVGSDRRLLIYSTLIHKFAQGRCVGAGDIYNGLMLNQPENESKNSDARIWMPAGFSPLSRIFLAPPHNRLTWPDALELAQKEFGYFIDRLADVLPVTLLNTNAFIDVDHPGISCLELKTNDSWIRDYGPIFTVRGGRLWIEDFRFNSWGNKYPPFDDDDAIAGQIAEHLGVGICRWDFVLEGGSIESNGQGVLLTTASCLLHPNRNPGLSQGQIEALLSRALGVERFIWLPGGIDGDDTDGHVDDVARFIGPRQIAVVRAPKSHPDHEALERNYRVLLDARDQEGQRFDLVVLPTPGQIFAEGIADWQNGNQPSRLALPASYANFLMANKHLFLPVFNQPEDALAISCLEDALPHYRIVPIPAIHLVAGLGALHCLSMEQPAI